jgi:hypothetical protein
MENVYIYIYVYTHLILYSKEEFYLQEKSLKWIRTYMCIYILYIFTIHRYIIYIHNTYIYIYIHKLKTGKGYGLNPREI